MNAAPEGDDTIDTEPLESMDEDGDSKDPHWSVLVFPFSISFILCASLHCFPTYESLLQVLSFFLSFFLPP